MPEAAWAAPLAGDVPPPHGGGRIAVAGPPPAEARLTAILLHGRGAAADDMLGLARALDLTDVAWICPEAASRTWYPASFLAEPAVNAAGVASAHALLESIVTGLADVGVPPPRIALGGFSQGACLATTHAWRHPRRYAAVIGLTGGLIGPPETAFDVPDLVVAPGGPAAPSDLAEPGAGSLARVPVLLASGDPDPHVPWPRVEETASVLGAMGAAVETMRLPGRPHTVIAQEVRRARAILGAEGAA